jgi:hypothetical protein
MNIKGDDALDDSATALRERWHEPAVVGAAVVLFGLGWIIPHFELIPGSERVDATASALSRSVAAESARPAHPPQGNQFYKNLWERETENYYAKGARESAATDSHKGSPSFRLASTINRLSVGSFVSEQRVARKGLNADQATVLGEMRRPDVARERRGEIMSPSNASVPVRRFQHRLTVYACLVSGLLASLAYVAIWPMPRKSSCTAFPGYRSKKPSLGIRIDELSQPGLNSGGAVGVELPSHWVGLRPTVGHSLRRGVMGTSYLLALLGAWCLMVT